MSTRDELIYMTKLTEQTERFEDMVNYIKQVVKSDQELSVEERNLLSVAYKNSIGGRRTAWRVLSSIETKEEQKVRKIANHKLERIQEPGPHQVLQGQDRARTQQLLWRHPRAHRQIPPREIHNPRGQGIFKNIKIHFF
jgi:hypothetical protein